MSPLLPVVDPGFKGRHQPQRVATDYLAKFSRKIQENKTFENENNYSRAGVRPKIVYVDPPLHVPYVKVILSGF